MSRPVVWQWGSWRLGRRSLGRSALHRWFWAVGLALLACAGPIAAPSLAARLNFVGVQVPLAQTTTPRNLPPSMIDLWRKAYEIMPELPREDGYTNRETKQRDLNSTLLSRLVRYHIYSKGRSPFYRLDWKITLADYLGAHQFLDEDSYPGAERLTENPLKGDLAVIRGLSRRQRDRLVTVLASLYNPRAAEPEPTATDRPKPEPTPESRPVNPPPGGADLLRL